VDLCFQVWFASHNLKPFRSLPLLVIHVIWVACNMAIFEGRFSPPEVVALREGNLFNSHSSISKPTFVNKWHIWFLTKVIYGHFLTGLAREMSTYVVFVFEHYYSSFKPNVGPETNNRENFSSLLYLLKFTNFKNLHSVQVMGDSSLVIKWMKNDSQVKNINFVALAQ